MSDRARAAVRLLVIVAGIAVTLASVTAFRRADWPIYLVFVLLSVVLFAPSVEVLPNLILPMPGLALCIGFLYVGGLPIIVLRNLAPPFLAQVLRWALPPRWRAVIPQAAFGGERLFSIGNLDSKERGLVAADWATFSLGLATRWGIVSWLVPGERPVDHALAMGVAEVGGYVCWAILSSLPILSFRPFPPSLRGQGARLLYQDLGVIMILALTPFAFLIAYGYRTAGLTGAAGWSLSALGLDVMLQRMTERRIRVEEQNQRLALLNRELEHRERLSAIGKMSSVVSHQMLQQLGVIGIHADLIRNATEGEDPAAARANAAAIEEALRALNRVLTDLLVFSRDLRLNLYQHQVRDLLEDCLVECRAAAAARAVRLRLDCPADGSATLDKLKVKQAVVNVLRNAIDASPGGDQVVVRAVTRDGWVQIAISDRGAGVPERDREALFTPFFTTKEHGTGLGLAIAREFTEAHGGRITVENGEPPGATFVLRLPIMGPLPVRSS
jgi:signal transduction histidine kinase